MHVVPRRASRPVPGLVLARGVLLRCALAAASLGFLNACSGAGSAPSTQASTESGHVTLVIPNKSEAKVARPKFVSPSASSVSIAVSGIASNVVADVSATSTNCTGTGPTRSCTIAVKAPLGSATFTVTIYDAPGATGTVLGSGSATQSISSGAPFTVAIPVAAVPGTIVVTTGTTIFTSGTPATTPVTVAVSDPDGNLVTGSYSSPVTLTNSDSTGSFTLSSTSVTSSTQVVTLKYNGAATVSSAAISASASGVPVTKVTAEYVQVLGSAGSGIYVANYGANSITVYAIGATGNAAPIRTLSGAATGLVNPEGLAVDGANEMYTNDHTNGTITVYPAGASGNTAPTRTLSDPSLPSPNGITIGIAGDLYASNCPTCSGSGSGSPAVVHFPAGATTSDRQYTSSSMSAPDSVTVDEAGNVYLNNGFTSGPEYIYAPNASGTVTATRQIGLNAPLSNIQSNYYAAGTLFISDPSGVYLFPSGASGTTTPSTTFSTSSIGWDYPTGMFLTTSGANPTLYVTDLFTPAIWILKTSGTPPNLTLVSTTEIVGAATGLNQPIGIFVIP